MRRQVHYYGGVMGLDLSLRSSGVCIIPAQWVPGDWNIPTGVVGHSLKKDATAAERAERISKTAAFVGDFASKYLPDRVFVEDYAYGLASAGTREVAELTGVVKYVLMARLSLLVEPVNQSTIRKYFLGKLPQKDRQVAVHSALLKLGCPFETSDQRDAFIVGNFGRTELGLPGLSIE